MHTLNSFARPIQALVIGSDGAIGGALVDRLVKSPHVQRIYACSRKPQIFEANKIVHRYMDILDEASIKAALEGTACVDVAIVATGALHEVGGLQPEKTWRSLEKEMLLQSFATNTVGPALVAKHVLPLLPCAGKSVFAALSARVGSISDNHFGGWYGYRASKAALNQIIRTLSIELKRYRKEAICVSLHPGTVDSTLSRPFQSSVPAGTLFNPEFAAERLLEVIEAVDVSKTGQHIAWDGCTIEP